jgi:hypothetical protein
LISTGEQPWLWSRNWERPLMSRHFYKFQSNGTRMTRMLRINTDQIQNIRVNPQHPRHPCSIDSSQENLFSKSVLTSGPGADEDQTE